MKIYVIVNILTFIYSNYTTYGQSIPKQESKAINRSKITIVHGDTIQKIVISSKRPSHPKADRFYHWYSDDRIVKAQGSFSGRLLHGECQTLNRAQNLLVQSSYHYGLKTGKWLTWYPSGQLASVSRWRKGSPRGKTYIYDQQGQRLREAISSSKKTPSLFQSGIGKLTRLKRREKQKTDFPAASPLNTAVPAGQSQNEAAAPKPVKQKKKKAEKDSIVQPSAG